MQLLTGSLPSSPDTERQRLIRQWLSDTPELVGVFTDGQGNPSQLMWNEYTNVSTPGKTAPSISTLCEFTRVDPNALVGCGPESSYTVALRIRVSHENILSAREALNDVLMPINERLKQTMNLNGERFKWQRSERSPGWTFTKEIKGNDGDYPGGTVTALGILLVEPCRR